MMTAKDLIEELKELPEDTIIKLITDDTEYVDVDNNYNEIDFIVLEYI